MRISRHHLAIANIKSRPRLGRAEECNRRRSRIHADLTSGHVSSCPQAVQAEAGAVQHLRRDGHTWHIGVAAAAMAPMPSASAAAVVFFPSLLIHVGAAGRGGRGQEQTAKATELGRAVGYGQSNMTAHAVLDNGRVAQPSVSSTRPHEGAPPLVRKPRGGSNSSQTGSQPPNPNARQLSLKRTRPPASARQR